MVSDCGVSLEDTTNFSEEHHHTVHSSNFCANVWGRENTRSPKAVSGGRQVGRQEDAKSVGSLTRTTGTPSEEINLSGSWQLTSASLLWPKGRPLLVDQVNT